MLCFTITYLPSERTPLFRECSSEFVVNGEAWVIPWKTSITLQMLNGRM